MTWPARADVGPDASVDWYYPNIYARDPKTGAATPLSRLRIGMMHVRAADDLVIEYDGQRDGYVIRRDLVVDRGSGMVTVKENVEVAFIPAWNTVHEGTCVKCKTTAPIFAVAVASRGDCHNYEEWCDPCIAARQKEIAS